MEYKFFCSWWGLDHLSLEQMLKKIKDNNYDGIEIGCPDKQKDVDSLKKLLEKHKLELIIHQYKAQGNFIDYKKSFKKELIKAANLNPLFITSHTGKDYWTYEQNKEILDIAFEVEELKGIKIIHETHRKHFLFSTFTAKHFFSIEPKLKITADLSHWTCVSETMLEDQPEIIEEAINRAEHIHARVGYEQGPQVPDPRDSQWQSQLEIFLTWWKKVAVRFKNENRKFLTITPEFGPKPYTWVLPNSTKTVSDFFEINLWMKDFLKNKLS